jgi:hypothetical protein
MTRTHEAIADDRTCFVHVGVHKTGTTAIQRFLAGNPAALARAGLYYPHAGRRSAALPGHHNVASELLGSANFDAGAGTLADVAAEIARVGAPRACLSSEKFAALCEHEAAMAALREAIATIGYRARVVVYVRAQPQYAESLYAELVKHGSAPPFVRYVDELVTDGLVRAHTTFHFEFGRLVERFASAFGRDAVIVRGYRDRGRAEPLVLDFLAAAGVTAALSPGLIAEPAGYENRRATTGEVIARLRAAAPPDEPHAGLPFHPLGPDDRARITARFAADNAELVRTWGVHPATFADDPPWRDSEPARRARELFARAEAARAEHGSRT